MGGSNIQLSIRKVVSELGAEYLMPAIQREFVWQTDQICALFDSVYRGFPIGALLLWTVKPPNVGDYGFYSFVTDYHELDEPFAGQADPDPSVGLKAVLDGQQRLTALNIGLRGSYTSRKRYGRRNNPKDYEEQNLYFNMKYQEPEGSGDPQEPEEIFVFKTDEEVSADSGEPSFFSPVSAIYGWGETPDWDLPEQLKQSNNLSEVEARRGASMAFKLHDKIKNPEGLLVSEIEFDDPDLVLEAFVRLNARGTTLSKADLLLAMATSQWANKDARQEVRGLVEELNSLGNGFDFDKAMVLKAGLAITDKSIGFTLKKFKKPVVLGIEAQWDAIKSSLMTAAKLLHHFGFEEKTLPVNDAVMLPLAMYLHFNGIDESVLKHKKNKPKRDSMHEYVLRACLIQGYWGRGLDTKLSTIRKAIQTTSGDVFPLAEVRAALEEASSSMEFGEDALDEILDLQYSKRHTFSALVRLTGDHLDLGKMTFHVDHVFPKKKLTSAALRREGLDDEAIDSIQDCKNSIPNLQLLPGSVNLEKQDVMPREWLDEMDEDEKQTYISDHLLGDVPEGVEEFLAWYENRSKRLRAKLVQLFE